jgi:DNA-binding SARP family transcriptional activator
MVRLKLLGPLDLRADDGAKVQDILRQPKRVALLIYLASTPPGTFHRRDTLLALFWPESDADRARDALNTALRYLRRGLGPNLIVSRGDEEVGLAAGGFWTDVAAFEEGLRAGRPSDALDLFRGDFLQGFHVADAPGLEEWMETERRRLRDLAVLGLRALTDDAVSADDGPLALLWARRAFALLSDDERVVRRLIEVLHAIGDAPGAVRLYEEFADRLRRELGAEPTEKTRAAAERVRRGEPPAMVLSSSGSRRTSRP